MAQPKITLYDLMSEGTLPLTKIYTIYDMLQKWLRASNILYHQGRIWKVLDGCYTSSGHVNMYCWSGISDCQFKVGPHW